MKVTNTAKPGFHPFTLEFFIESEEDARAMYAIFNHCSNLELFKKDMSASEFMDAKYGRLFSGDIIANNVTYNKFYSSGRN